MRQKSFSSLSLIRVVPSSLDLPIVAVDAIHSRVLVFAQEINGDSLNSCQARQDAKHESIIELILCHHWCRLKHPIGEQKKRKKKLFDVILLLLLGELDREVYA
jgi:hypothetical protein